MAKQVVPTEGDLLQLLDKEIENARAEAQQGGWTTWALTGSFFAVIWLALTTWGEAAIQISFLWKWIIVLSIPIDALAASIWSWIKQDQRSMGEIRYRRSIEFEPHRLAYCFWSIRTVGLAFIAVAAGTGVLRWAVIVASIYYSILAISVFALVLISFFDYAFKISHPSETSWVTWLTWFGFLAGLLAVELAFARTLPFPRPGNQVDTLALASLLVVAQLLLFRLLYDLKPVRVIPQLVEIRRDLVFRRVDLMTAARSAEVVLLGLGPGSVVEEYLRKLLVHYRRYDSLAANAWRAIAELTTRTNALEGAKKGTSRDRERFSGAGREQLRKVRKLMGQVDRTEKHVQRRSEQFDALVREVRGEAPQLLQEWKAGVLLKLAQTADREDKAFREMSLRLHEDYAIAVERWEHATKALPRDSVLGNPST
jgi:hypothetical protein